jgi:hypothetical protein
LEILSYWEEKYHEAWIIQNKLHHFKVFKKYGIQRVTSPDRFHLQPLAMQKNETVRNTGRNMLAGRMQRTSDTSHHCSAGKSCVVHPPSPQVFTIETVATLQKKHAF